MEVAALQLSKGRGVEVAALQLREEGDKTKEITERERGGWRGWVQRSLLICSGQWPRSWLHTSIAYFQGRITASATSTNSIFRGGWRSPSVPTNGILVVSDGSTRP